MTPDRTAQSAKLIGEEGLLKGQVLTLDDGTSWTIGRDPDQSDIVVEDPAASRKHLLCRVTDEGFILENLSSTNPVTINEVEISEPQLLQDGDLVILGASKLRFYSSSGAVIDTASPVNTAEEHILPDEKPLPSGGGMDMDMTSPPPEETEEQQALPPAAAPDAAPSTPAEEPPEENHRDTLFEDEGSSGQDRPVSEADMFSDVDVDLSGGGRWMLKVISGPNNGAEFGMQSGQSYVMGNDPSACDIVFHDISVSRQHARMNVSDDEVLSVEDLGSRNGTQVDGDSIEERTSLEANKLVTVGSSTFVIIDREGERSTIVSPPLASLGTIFQSTEAMQAAQAAVQGVPKEGAPATEAKAAPSSEEIVHALEERETRTAGTLIFLGILTGLFLVLGMAALTLFQSEPVAIEMVDSKKALSVALNDFPEIQHSYTESTGTLLLLGHVSTNVDRSQLLYNLQGLPFVKNVDDNIVIDELVWQEANQVLSKNPAWRSVTVQSPSPGRFVMTGYIRNQSEAERLNDYISLNFPYPELLENQVVVEESIVSKVATRLSEARLLEVSVSIGNGELTLEGIVGNDKIDEYKELLLEFRDMRGVRNIRNFVVEVEPQETMVDLSDRYEVTGFSNVGGINVNVVINGRILTIGDTIDGLRITDIKDGTIFLDKDGFKYRIKFNK
ncbi:Uncharacterized protein SCG7086_AN_00150 [Chlamydiales bacterium SCGC AG-110-P3]|nr:Uncharacterized protein SCG7086_AN_00150 [Chlamydiales bacterium SCGC AG-110-P3]